MQLISVISSNARRHVEEKASLGIRLKTQKNAILHFFLDFSVIIRYDSADIGTISIK